MTAPVLDFAVIERLIGNRLGVFDTPCPECSAGRKPAHQRLKVFHLWRADPDFASFSCAHCGLDGFARRSDRTSQVDKQEIRRRRVEAHRQDVDDKRRRTSRALTIWAAADPIERTIAARYLINRGVDLGALPNDMTGVLRFRGRCPWGPGEFAPCLVGLWTDTITGEPRAIHRTAITPDAQRIDRRSLGPIAGCVMRLWPDEDVTDGLVIGEGLETVLAAATRAELEGTLLVPAWANGSAGNLRDFAVLPGIGALTILVDNDESGTGQAAAEICARRWTSYGCEVIRLTPHTPGTDLADIVEAG